jgi:N-acetylglucosamine repressor
MRRISPTSFRVARRGTPREINRQIALNLIRERQPISRADLARVMGVRPGAVTRLVDELLHSGLVFEGAKGESKRGRKPTHIFLETRRRCAVAVDISASLTALMVTDVLGHPLLAVREFPTRRRPDSLVKELIRSIERIFAEHPEVGECVGVGVVVSGIVDLEGRRLKFSPTLGWRDVDLLGPLQAAIKLPVVVENSTKACILAQVWAVRGDMSAEGPVAFVNVSDGVGVGIAVDGKLVRGAHNVAGEFGHVPLNMYGPRCSCGLNGCLEAYVSKRATIARYLGTEPSWPESAESRGVTVEDIIARARAGQGRALEALRETGYYLGRGLALIIKSVDPQRVYIGGEITRGWDLIQSAVREAIREQCLIHEAGETEILVVPLDDYPRLRGAAALVSTSAFAAPVVA